MSDRKEWLQPSAPSAQARRKHSQRVTSHQNQQHAGGSVNVMFFGSRSTGQIGVIFGQPRDGKFRTTPPAGVSAWHRPIRPVCGGIRPQLRQHRRRIRAADIDLGEDRKISQPGIFRNAVISAVTASNQG